MKHEHASPKRLFVAWMVALATLAAAASADLLLYPSRAHVAGLDVSGGLRAATYAALVAVAVTSVRWLRALRVRRTRTITVRELRELAGRR
jgi:hypothetical protein